MTEIESAQKTPPRPLPSPGSDTAMERPAPMARLVGVDLARALAVFGMFAVHVGPMATPGGGVGDWFLELASGRASALFATLAGFSLMLIAGRFEPKTGLAGRQAKARIAIRAVILLVLGSALAMTNFGGAGILNFYAVYFLLALPLLRLRARTLAAVAVTLAVVTPQLAYVIRALLTESIVHSIDAYDPIARLCGVGVVDLLLTGLYPAITWMTFVVTGMALGRLDLSSGTVRRRLAVVGPATIAFGYGVSWLALRLTGGAQKIMDGMPAMKDPGAMKDAAMASGSFDSPVGGGLGGPDAWGLLAAEPHTGSTFDLIGSLGIAITVLLCLTVALDRLPWLRRLATPIIAVGTMSLTLYVGHILVILALPGEAATPPQSASAALLLCFVVGATGFGARAPTASAGNHTVAPTGRKLRHAGNTRRWPRCWASPHCCTPGAWGTPRSTPTTARRYGRWPPVGGPSSSAVSTPAVRSPSTRCPAPSGPTPSSSGSTPTPPCTP